VQVTPLPQNAANHFGCRQQTTGIYCPCVFWHQLPKATAEYDITFLSPAPGADGICGAPLIQFDYELGEKEFYKGLVCDEYKGSNRVEKLPLPQSATAIVSKQARRLNILARLLHLL
jgi:hypothetical protein